MEPENDPATIDFYPFAYALYNEFLSEYCWYCLDEERKHLRCSACSVAIFCNKECQQLAWKDHKFECKALKKCSQVPDIEVRLLGRIVAISSGNAKEDPTFYKDRHSRRNVMDVWAHTKNIRNDPYAMQKFTDIYGRLIQFYDSKALLPKDVIFELHCRDFINRHAISDKAYLKEIGKGLYCDLCAYDHSCKPNTIYTCNGFVATLRPLNTNCKASSPKVAKGYMVSILQYFHCDCERCVDNSEHVLTSVYCPQCKAKNLSSELCLFGHKEYKDMEIQVIQCPKCNETLSKEEVMQALAGMRFIDDLLDKTNFEEMGRSVAIDFLKDLLHKFENMLPKVNIYYCRLIQALIPLIDPADHEQLLQLHLDAEECVRICYPPNHPALAFHLRNIGIFYKSLRQFTMAAKYLSQAHEAFQFVMTPKHQLACSTTSMLLEVNRAMEKYANSTNNGEEASNVDRYPEVAVCPPLEVHNVDDKTEVDKKLSTINSREGITNVDQIFLSVTNCENQDMTNADTEDKHETIEEAPAMVVRKFEETRAKSNVTNLLVTPEENISGSLLCIKIGENTTSDEPKLKISPSSLSESSGVKKKASLKKVAPRARTPLPPREVGNMKSDLSYVEDDPSNDAENEVTCKSLLEIPKETLGQTQESKLCIESAEKITFVSGSDLLLKSQATY
ncbi:MYND finger domain-containing protein [Ditylenchus destructor]|uniref:MYND finger domain-containing protein n=1 Tax=Ditylenchus destructor TaxID=166010 RepID=A0AAD4NCA5_9BILA|nr:MYND finger domain-containing protein [Ditylenchus destructor]